MKTIFQRKNKPAEEKIYGLIGFPLTHSFSQTFFNQKFSAEHINARYLNFEIPDIGDFMEILAEYPNIGGLNVTIPYKTLVMPYLTDIDPVAKRIGAVNVIRVVRNGKSDNDFKLVGYNSDIAGFMNSIRPMLQPYHKAALVLGSGGACKAVCCGLEDLGVKPLVVSRTPKEGMISYDDITPEIMNTHKVIVNTTPLGMYPHVDECPDLPYELIDKEFLCYDLLYNPDVTLFMKKSAGHGAVTKNGLEMLLLQAFESWEIWTGKR
ncbi:MAG: shikimate dehydrogenase [Bacteroidales bacterium]|nr:shikimate dehydrogenase [Bacteroidales bacterium]